MGTGRCYKLHSLLKTLLEVKNALYILDPVLTKYMSLVLHIFKQEFARNKHQKVFLRLLCLEIFRCVRNFIAAYVNKRFVQFLLNGRKSNVVSRFTLSFILNGFQSIQNHHPQPSILSPSQQAAFQEFYFSKIIMNRPPIIYPRWP